MRYRERSTVFDIAGDIDAFVDLIGVDEYRNLLERLGKGLAQKGYVTAVDEMRFALEGELRRIEMLRGLGKLQNGSWLQNMHEGTDFLIGMGQTIRVLSSAARSKLRGMVVGGLKTHGLRALQHELRVAAILSQLNYDVEFHDLEHDGGFDFLATGASTLFEVEAKALPVYSGNPILPHDADKLFLELRNGFDTKFEIERVPIVTVELEDRLPTARAALLRIVEASNLAVAQRNIVDLSGLAKIDFTGAIALAPIEKLKIAAMGDALKNNVHTYVAEKSPHLILRLSSAGKSRFAHNIVNTVHDAAKRQLSGTRPGVVCLQIDHISPEQFALLARGQRPSALDGLASAAFIKANRPYLRQIVFSGGAHLKTADSYARSMTKHEVYSATDETKRQNWLFPNGKVRRPAIGRSDTNPSKS